MKAIVTRRYGSPDVLKLEELEKPIPGDNQILIKVHAAAANAADWRLLRAKPFFIRFVGLGLTRPRHRIPGSDVAGTVEVAGKNVTRFHKGDQVFADISDCGRGAFAQYVCADEDIVVSKPSNMSFEEAAAVPMAALTALHCLRDAGKVRPGQQVLINGASGGVGTFAVQIAKALGAEITAVCSTGKIDLVRSLGADHVIDYTREDFTKNGQQYDLILAVNGYQPICNYHQALKPGGTYIVAGGSSAQLMQGLLLGPLLSAASSKKMIDVTSKANGDDLQFVANLINDGKVKPVIDRRYRLNEVPEAIRYLEEGHARGKVVITVAA